MSISRLLPAHALFVRVCHFAISNCLHGIDCQSPHARLACTNSTLLPTSSCGVYSESETEEFWTKSLKEYISQTMLQSDEEVCAGVASQMTSFRELLFTSVTRHAYISTACMHIVCMCMYKSRCVCVLYTTSMHIYKNVANSRSFCTCPHSILATFFTCVPSTTERLAQQASVHPRSAGRLCGPDSSSHRGSERHEQETLGCKPAAHLQHPRS